MIEMKNEEGRITHLPFIGKIHAATDSSFFIHHCSFLCF